MPKVKPEKINNCLIICNGEIDGRLLQKFFKFNIPDKKFYVIAADGAANTLRKYGLAPDLITGDFDSIEPATLKFYKSQKKIEVRKIFNQNRNDLDKAFGFALVRGFQKIHILGATGSRLDHTLGNFSIIKKYYKLSDIIVYDKEYESFFCNEKTEFTYPKGEIVSLMPMPKAEKINSVGLKYKLKNATLEFGKMTGTLNSSTGDIVKIETGKGDLLVIKKHFGEINFI
jgi:thiamine pyrophosphokinase